MADYLCYNFLCYNILFPIGFQEQTRIGRLKFMGSTYPRAWNNGQTVAHVDGSTLLVRMRGKAKIWPGNFKFQLDIVRWMVVILGPVILKLFLSILIFWDLDGNVLMWIKGVVCVYSSLASGVSSFTSSMLLLSLQVICNGPGTCIPVCLAAIVMKVKLLFLCYKS